VTVYRVLLVQGWPAAPALPVVDAPVDPAVIAVSAAAALAPLESAVAASLPAPAMPRAGAPR
jgi:hypothetical protein